MDERWEFIEEGEKEKIINKWYKKITEEEAIINLARAVIKRWSRDYEESLKRLKKYANGDKWIQMTEEDFFTIIWPLDQEAVEFWCEAGEYPISKVREIQRKIEEKIWGNGKDEEDIRKEILFYLRNYFRRKLIKKFEKWQFRTKRTRRKRRWKNECVSC